ncbi:hypothetical protein [Streptomyces sp. NPDC018000]|uniref:hypothetical protein n=1 Tax=Streptomyces sp. NPDC018000 TaxID=3365028 RepID=UPI0037BABB18
MAELHDGIAQEVTGLQAEITVALQGLDSIDEDDPQYAAAFTRLVQAGTARSRTRRRFQPGWSSPTSR